MEPGVAGEMWSAWNQFYAVLMFGIHDIQYLYLVSTIHNIYV